MGEGWEGVQPEVSAEMKKYPIAGAQDRARSLRREMTDAENSVWRILRLYQIDGHRFRRQGLWVVTSLILFATTRS